MSSPVPTKARPETQTVKEEVDAFLDEVDELLGRRVEKAGEQEAGGVVSGEVSGEVSGSQPGLS